MWRSGGAQGERGGTELVDAASGSDVEVVVTCWWRRRGLGCCPRSTPIVDIGDDELRTSLPVARSRAHRAAVERLHHVRHGGCPASPPSWRPERGAQGDVAPGTSHRRPFPATRSLASFFILPQPSFCPLLPLFMPLLCRPSFSSLSTSLASRLPLPHHCGYVSRLRLHPFVLRSLSSRAMSSPALVKGYWRAIPAKGELPKGRSSNAVSSEHLTVHHAPSHHPHTHSSPPPALTYQLPLASVIVPLLLCPSPLLCYLLRVRAV